MVITGEDGSSVRRASASDTSSHVIATVARCQSSQPVSIVRSSAFAGGRCRAG
jgi:hypothetical protein